MLFRFSLYGFLKNQRYFEPFLMLVILRQGFSFLDFGLLISCREFTINLLEIPSGVAADSFGRRRSMVTSFVAYLISFAIFSLAESWWAFVAAMVVFGVADSFRTGTHKAMIFEWLRLRGRENERTKVYGFTRSWSKIGSAVSSLLAAALVAWINDLRWVFALAAAPYALNLINLATYPRELDGMHAKAANLRDVWRQTKTSLGAAFRLPELRGLMMESAGWDGFFVASREYLQPILAALAAMLPVAWFASSTSADVEPRAAALLIGPTYFLLYILSAIASRQSHRLVAWAGSLSVATRWLWLLHAAICLLLWLAGAAQWSIVLSAGFVLLHAAQNLWRPILVSRFDDHGDPASGATLLSVESQARRIGALALAPLLGWAVDQASGLDEPSYWPLGVIGLVISLAMLARRRKRAVVR